MSPSFYSPSWYRVANLKPRLRSHVEIHRHIYRGEVWYIMQDHATGKFQRFTPAAYLLIGLMNGKHSVQEIWEISRQRLKDDAPTQEEIISLLSQLHSVDALQADVPPDTAELLKRHEKKQDAKWKQNIRNPLAMRFPLFDPENFLNRWQFLVRPFFNWAGGIFWLMIVGMGVILAAFHWSELTENITDRVLAPQNLFLLWLTFPLLKALHEFGHAFTIKFLGGEVHEMGIIFLVLTPIPYVDASSASSLASKWQRILVGGAGMAVELFVAAIALLIWTNISPGLSRAVLFNLILIAGVSSLLFNGNPLLRYDGYYMLADLLEIPNLAPRGGRYLAYLVQRFLFGIKDVEPVVSTPGERFWFIIYTILSFAYRIFIYFSIILFIASKYFIVGLLLAIWAFISMIIWPVARGAKFLFISPRVKPKRGRALLVTCLILTCFLAFIFFVPFPLNTQTEGVIWIPETSYVRAGTEGFVERLLKEPGSRVKKQDLLIECADPFLPAQIKVLAARLQELKVQLDTQLLMDRVQADITKEEIKKVTAELERAQERANELTIRSLAEGIFICPLARDLPGKFVKRGELIGYVLDRQEITARVVIKQSDIDLVRQKTKGVKVRFPEKISEIIPSAIKREVPAATDQLPSRTLSHAGGGEMAIDPRDTMGLKAFEKIFLFDLELPKDWKAYHVGGRVYARFDHGWEPLIWRWYRSVRELFLRKFNV